MPKASTFTPHTASQMVESDRFPFMPNAGGNGTIDVSELRDVVGLGYRLTINAARFAGISDEAKIQAAIDHAVNISAQRVSIPMSMLPYDASLITFHDDVQMVREGGEYSVWDWQAYGAAGDETQDDSVSIQAAIDACIASGGGRSYGPSGRYRTDLDIVVIVTDPPIALTIFGEFASTVLVPGSAVNVCLNIGSSSSDPQILSRVVVQGIQLDGINTSAGAVTGLKIGDSTITNPPAPYSTYATFRDVSIYNFLGTGAIGLWVADLVVGNWENCYVGHCKTNLKVASTDGNFPTVLTFTKTHFRSATGNGIELNSSGFGITFDRCVIEANANYGVYSVPTGAATLVNIVFRGCWCEGNYQGDSSKWQAHFDGSAAGTLSVKWVDCNFAGVAKSLYITQAHNVVIDNVVPTNFAGTVTIDVGVDGKMENWPDVSAAYATRFVNNSPTTFRYIYPEMDALYAPWLTWTPAYTPISGGTFTSVTTQKAAYRIVGKTMFATLLFDGTTSIANAGFYVTLPTNVRSKDNLQFNLCRISDSVGNELGVVETDGASPTTSMILYKIDGTTIASGAGAGARASLIFELF